MNFGLSHRTQCSTYPWLSTDFACNVKRIEDKRGCAWKKNLPHHVRNRDKPNCPNCRIRKIPKKTMLDKEECHLSICYTPLDHRYLGCEFVWEQDQPNLSRKKQDNMMISTLNETYTIVSFRKCCYIVASDMTYCCFTNSSISWKMHEVWRIFRWIENEPATTNFPWRSTILIPMRKWRSCKE